MATAELQRPIKAIETEVRVLPIKSLKLTGTTQSRETLSNELIAEYAEEMMAGTEFPPIVVFFDGFHYYPSDGFHRIKAAQRAKRDSINAIVHQGSKRDAILASFSANVGHGLRRTNADKRRAITRMLEDDEWTRLSDLEIARRCSVTPQMVSASRIRLGIASPTFRTVTRNGKEQLVNTSKITGRPKKPPVLETPNFAAAAVAELQRTLPTIFEAFLKRIKARGVEAKTHVPTDFGPIDIVTADAVYIIAGNMTQRVFRDAFVTLLFQKRKKNDDKRAVIVGMSNEEVSTWVREAKRFGIEFLEFKG